jgi:hypothetical protein
LEHTGLVILDADDADLSTLFLCKRRVTTKPPNKAVLETTEKIKRQHTSQVNTEINLFISKMKFENALFWRKVQNKQCQN